MIAEETSEDKPEGKVETKVSISQEQLDKIEKFVTEKRFEDRDDFIEQALRLLIYAEDRKEDFEKILSM